MLQNKITSKYPPARWTVINRVLIPPLDEGWVASRITITFAAASPETPMPGYDSWYFRHWLKILYFLAIPQSLELVARIPVSILTQPV
jgi:hypothetical protein